MIERMVKEKSMDLFKTALATLTGGSGAIAVLLTDGSFSTPARRRLIGGVAKTDPQFYDLCRWHVDLGDSPDTSQYMRTDSVAVLNNGADLGYRTWMNFLNELGWNEEIIDKIICHQVGSGHQSSILKKIGISDEKDYVTYPYLGNIGTVSLPITAAIAEEREWLEPGNKVGFLGIGSGLNTLMLGWEW
jgi:3-oxoacyl-[acyl-carrier-protein] synthase-3